MDITLNKYFQLTASKSAKNALEEKKRRNERLLIKDSQIRAGKNIMIGKASSVKIIVALMLVFLILGILLFINLTVKLSILSSLAYWLVFWVLLLELAIVGFVTYKKGSTQNGR